MRKYPWLWLAAAGVATSAHADLSLPLRIAGRGCGEDDCSKYIRILEERFLPPSPDSSLILKGNTAIAGIQMPAGTVLQLPEANAVGQRWVKPEYFEKAQFAKPVLWQGIPIRTLWRHLTTHEDNQPTAEDLTSSDPARLAGTNFATTRITWGDTVETRLAQPVQIDGFQCQDEVNWVYRPAGSVNRHSPDTDAAQPAPRYRFNGCVLSGQRFDSANGLIGISLPEGSRVSSDRLIGQGYRDIWTVQDKQNRLKTSLFTLEGYAKAQLDERSHHLIALEGDIGTATTQCPLPKGSTVVWHERRPEELQVYSRSPVVQCGTFKIISLRQRPERIKWMTLEPAEERQ